MPKNYNTSLLGLGQLSWLTLAVAAIAVLAQTNFSVNQYLAYDRAAIQAGEVWRLVTGHVTHWSGDHLLWDVIMFLTLGVIVERRNRIAFIITLIASATAIATMLWFCHPTIGQYRGLSGIDSALFTHAALMLCTDARRAERRMTCRLISFSVVGFAAKIGYELVTGNTLFVDSSQAGFTALPSVHLIGGLVGGLCGGTLVCRVQGQPTRDPHASSPARIWATTSRMSS